jgi:hypothetical protein
MEKYGKTQLMNLQETTRECVCVCQSNATNVNMKFDKGYFAQPNSINNRKINGKKKALNVKDQLFGLLECPQLAHELRVHLLGRGELLSQSFGFTGIVAFLQADCNDLDSTV